jgi:hypothetical protein
VAGQPLLVDVALNVDIHLLSPQEAVADIAGPDPERTVRRLAEVLTAVHPLRSRRFSFPVGDLDRLLCVRRPSRVTLDAAALCVARAIWAHAAGWRPLVVDRVGRRLIARSRRWPADWRIEDAPWQAVLCLEHLGIPYTVAERARTMFTRRLVAAGRPIAEGGLAGSAIVLDTRHPELVEALRLPALSYAGPPGTGRYRVPVLAAEALLRDDSVRLTADARKAIQQATAPLQPSHPTGEFPWTLFGFQARDLAAGERIVAHTGGVLFAGEMGSGKSVSRNARCMTPVGPRRTGDLVVGDAVLGSDGRPYRVQGVFPQGRRQLWRLTFTDGTTVDADDDHLWAVHSPGRSQDAVLTTRELRTSRLRDPVGDLCWYVPLISAPLQMDCGGTRPVPPYTLGVLLGAGGGLTGPADLTGTGGQVAAAVQADLDASDLAGVTVEPVTAEDYRLVDPAQPGNRLVRALTELGLREKAVPDAYRFGPPEVRAAVLQGLLDTGGGVARSPSSVGFTAPSRRLVDDVRWLVESLGGTGRVSGPVSTVHQHRDRTVGTIRPVWQLDIALPEWVEPFRAAAKAGAWRSHPQSRPSRGVVSVERAEVDDAVCIAVDSPDHLFVVDHAVVTHNTTVSLGLVHNLDLWPLLVVAPLAAFSTWQRQLDEMGRSAYLCTEPVAVAAERLTVERFDAVVVSYDRLHVFAKLIGRYRFAVIVADEIQRIRTPGSRRSRTLRALAHTVPVRVGLSGTPVTNRPEDVLPIGAFLVPGEWRPRLTSAALAELYPGDDPLESLAEHLGTMMVRRRMAHTGVQLPGRRVHRVPVPLSTEQRRALEELEAEARQASADGELTSHMHVFARLQRMRQIVNVPAAAGVGGPNAKVKAAVELAAEYSELGRKSVVFVADRPAWREVGERLDALGIGWTGVWGSTSVADRIANERRFHTDDTIRVFVGTLAACAESLTLSPTATVTIFAALSYSPSAIAQAAARTYRMNQTNDIDEIYLMATAPGGTLDDRMHEILEAKRSLIAQVVDRDTYTDPAAQVTFEDLLFLVTGRRDATAAAVAADDADAVARREARRRHARATLFRRKTGEVLDDGSAALTREEWARLNSDPDDVDPVVAGADGELGGDAADLGDFDPRFGP